MPPIGCWSRWRPRSWSPRRWRSHRWRRRRLPLPPGHAGPPTGSCDLQSKGGKIKHVIYLQFDNVHFQRDNPNVPSDLEQMPHLLQLPQGQRHVRHERPHHPDLAHGRRDPELAHRALSRPARAGRLELVRLLPAATARSGFSSSFKYWTDFTDGGNPANNPPTPSADTNYNMVNNDPASLGGTGAVRNAPAPWVPFTRAGCDVGNVGRREHRAREQHRDQSSADAARRRSPRRQRRRDEHQRRDRRRPRGRPDDHHRDRDANVPRWRRSRRRRGSGA